MTDYTDLMIDEVLRTEGGYSDRPADRGGPTNRGITIATLSEWRGRPATIEEVQGLTQTQAREIYHARYLLRPNIGAIASAQLRWHVLDAAVNHGPWTAVKLLQRAVGTARDGLIGPQTLAAIAAQRISVIVERYIAKRCRLYAEIVKDPQQAQAHAWIWFVRLARVCEFGARLPE